MRQVRLALHQRLACAPVSLDAANHPQTGAPQPIPGGHVRRRTGNGFGTEVLYRRYVSYLMWRVDDGDEKRSANHVARACQPTPTLTNRLGVALMASRTRGGAVRQPHR